MMICPNCKNEITTIKARETSNNSILRKKYCYKCDVTYQTIETIKTPKAQRKPRPSKILMNFRFYVYGNYRLAEALRTFISLTNQHPQKNKDEYTVSNNKGRISFIAKDFKNQNGKKTEKIFKKTMEKKIVTIEKILSSKDYWNYKNHLFSKNKLTDDQIIIINQNFIKHGLKKWRKKAYSEKNEDEKILVNLVYKERQQYLKSVAMYIKSDEYNQEFFKNYKIDKKVDGKLGKQIELASYWSQQIAWHYYSISR